MPQYRDVHRKNRSLLKKMQRKGGRTDSCKDFITRVSNGQKLDFLMNNEEIEKENIRRLRVLENHPNQRDVQLLADTLISAIDDDKITGSLADIAFAQEVIKAVVLSRIVQFRQFLLSEIRAVTLYFDTPEILISKLPKTRRTFDRQMSRLREFMDDHVGEVRNGSYWFCAELGATASGKVLVHAHGLVSGDYINLVDEYLRRNELVSKRHRRPFKMTPLRCTAANASDMPENEQRDYAVGKWTAYALKLTTHQKIPTKSGERSIRRVPMKPNEEIAMLRFYNKHKDYVMMIHGNVQSEQNPRKIQLKKYLRASGEKRNLSRGRKSKRFETVPDGSVVSTTAKLISCNLFESGRNYSEQFGTTPELDDKVVIPGLKRLICGTSQNKVPVVIVEGEQGAEIVKYDGEEDFRKVLISTCEGAGIKAFSPTNVAKLLLLVDKTQSTFSAHRIDHAGLHKIEHHGINYHFFVSKNGDLIGKVPEHLLIYPTFDRCEDAGYSGSWATYENEVSELIRDQPNLVVLFGAALVPLIQQFAEFSGYREENVLIEITGKNSVGKSSVMESLSVAVWGSTEMMRSLNATSNAIEEIALEYSNMLLALDEATAIDGNVKNRAGVLTKLAHAFTQNNSRARLNEETKKVPPFLAVLSSNESLLQIARESDGVLGGLDARLLTIDAHSEDWMFNGGRPPCDPSEFIDRLGKVARANYGHLSRMFAHRLVQELDRDPDALKKRLNMFATSFMTQAANADEAANADDQGNARRKAAKFSLIYAALKLAQVWSILPSKNWGKFGKPIIAAMQACLSVNEPVLTVERKIKAALMAFQQLALNSSNSVFDLEKYGVKEMPNKKFRQTIFKGKRSDGMWFLAFPSEQFLADKLPGFKGKLQILKDAGKLSVERKNGKLIGYKDRVRLRIKYGYKKSTPESCYMVFFKRPHWRKLRTEQEQTRKAPGMIVKKLVLLVCGVCQPNLGEKCGG